MLFLKLFVPTFVVYVLLDVVWLRFIGKYFYVQDIGLLMKNNNINWFSALIVYIVITLGILVFVLPKSHEYLEIFSWGLFFGLVVYASYNFTNYAILENWPLRISFIDTCWGMLVCGATSVFAAYLRSFFT